MFLSNFAGKESFAAVGFITPYLMMFNSVGFMFGTGGSALIAKMMGEKKHTDANETFSSLVLASVFTGLLLSVIGQLFLKSVTVLQGAEGALLEQILLYGRIYLLGTPACMVQFEFQALYQTSGKDWLGLKAAVVSGMTNIALDVLLLAVFSLGTAGTAIATVFSQLIGGLLPLLFYSRKNDSQPVKGPVVAYNEFSDTIINDILFNSSTQIRIYFFTCLPMSDEKTAFNTHFTVTSTLLRYLLPAK